MTTHPYIQGRLAALHTAEIRKQAAAVSVTERRRTIHAVLADLAHGRVRRLAPAPCCHPQAGTTRT